MYAITFNSEYRDSDFQSLSKRASHVEWHVEILMTGSGLEVKNRMLRGVINLAPEVYNLFDLGGKISAKNAAVLEKATF